MKKFDSINVIPFVDILLVLLTIVLMTSTFIAKGILPIDVPKSASTQTLEPSSVVLSIDEQGALFLEKTPISHEALQSHLETLASETRFSINCAKQAPFEFFVSLLDMLNAHHFKSIDIVIEK